MTLQTLIEVECTEPGCRQIRLVDSRAASFTKYCREHAAEIHRQRQRERERAKRAQAQIEQEPVYKVVKADNFPIIDILESALNDYLEHGWFDDAAELVRDKVRYAVRRVGKKQELVRL